MLERGRIERNAITWCQKLKSHERNHPPVQSRSGTKYEFQSDAFEKFPKPKYFLLDTKMFVSYGNILIFCQSLVTS